MPEWLDLFLALGGSAAISTFIAILFNNTAKSIEKRKEDVRKLEALQEKQEEQKFFNDLKDNLMRDVTNTLVPLDQNLNDLKTYMELNKKASVTSIRATLKMLHDKYLAQGFADVGDKATWMELLDNYQSLGGNHFKEYVDIWRDDIEQLPTRKK